MTVCKGSHSVRGSLQTMFLSSTPEPRVESHPWLLPVIHFFDVHHMEFRINQNSGATRRRADTRESFSCEYILLILSSLHSPPRTVFFCYLLPSVVSSLPIYTEIRFTPTQLVLTIIYLSLPIAFFSGQILKNKE